MDLHLSQVSIKALEEAFRVFDSENAGYVSSKVFKDVVEGAGLDDHTKVFDPFIQMADQPIKMNQFIKIISNQVVSLIKFLIGSLDVTTKSTIRTCSLDWIEMDRVVSPQRT